MQPACFVRTGGSQVTVTLVVAGERDGGVVTETSTRAYGTCAARCKPCRPVTAARPLVVLLDEVVVNLPASAPAVERRGWPGLSAVVAVHAPHLARPVAKPSPGVDGHVAAQGRAMLRKPTPTELASCTKVQRAQEQSKQVEARNETSRLGAGRLFAGQVLNRWAEGGALSVLSEGSATLALRWGHSGPGGPHDRGWAVPMVGGGERLVTVVPNGGALPSFLSPTRAAEFRQCGLKFYFSAVERWRSPATEHTALGNVVHDVAEALYRLPAVERTRDTASELLTRLWPKWQAEPGHEQLLSAGSGVAVRARAEAALDGLFELEDPTAVLAEADGLEAWVSAPLYRAPVRGGSIG